MGIEAAKNEFLRLRGTLGKRGLNAAFPNDFELYLFAFELVNSQDESLEYFILPVNPKNIRETEQPLVNIRKTGQGFTSMTNSSFQQKTIRITGNFGKKFKFLLGGNIVDVFGGIADLNPEDLKSTIRGTKKVLKEKNFNPKIKTGYGVLKKFKSILDTSNKPDQYFNPHTLYFYNLALGTYYIVKNTRIDYSQNMESNMIWEYELEMTAVSEIDRPKSLRRTGIELSVSQVVQKGVNNALNNVRGSLGI